RVGAHRHRDNLLDRDRAALLDLHGGLDGVCVERVEVLLAAAVQAHRVWIDALLHCGVRYLLDQDADLQVEASLESGFCRLTDQSISPWEQFIYTRSGAVVRVPFVTQRGAPRRPRG